VRRIAIALVRAYQRGFSLLLGPRCRFHPTCSQYTIESIERFGTPRGLLLGFFRILRCQPLAEGGIDPVPATFPRRPWRRPPRPTTDDSSP
jgi:uncharacterized protein